MSESEATPPVRPTTLEIKAMARIDKILNDLPPASAQRVVRWADSVTEERVDEQWGTQFDIDNDPEF